MSLQPGARLGPYEVAGLIGEGGMGQVYRARDTRLDRDVAIKILPEAFEKDTERLARFQREAKILASLNHPNIAAIYGLERSDDGTALVLELVEGPTLADRIADGPVPLDEALPIANQISLALEAAHEQGIVHRDLKPANIKVRPDGAVKVLDFGLAKALAPESGTSSLSMSPTLSLTAGTRMGTVIGTAAYMAPEQAKGKAADQRADVWAFGAVLYEMLAGKRAFAGDDISDTLVAVLRDEPDWAALPAEVPSGVRQALRVCLQKDPKKRVRDMSAIRLALDGVFDSPTASLQPAAVRSRARWPIVLPWALGTFILGGAGAAFVVRSLNSPPAVSVERFVITTPAAIVVGGSQPLVAMSRDGSHIVYRATMPGQLPSATSGAIYLRDRDQLEPVLIRGTEGATGSFLSPDGEWVGFNTQADSALKRVSIHGGPTQTICKLDGALRGADWGDDDRIVFATANTKGLRIVNAAGGEPAVLTKVDPANGETDHFWPDILPGGQSVLFTGWNGSPERSQIAVVSLPDGKVSTLLPGGTSPRFARGGYVVFAAGDALRAVRFDADRLAVTGNPVPIVERVVISPQGSAQYATGEDGALVYIHGSTAATVGQRTLFWVDRQGHQEAIDVPPRAYTYARLSPDNTRVALDARDQQSDIWILDLRRGGLQRLTTDLGFNRSPVWTNDSRRVAFTAERDGKPESIYWQAADGSGTVERLSIGSTVQGAASFTPDDKQLVFNSPLSPPFDIGLLDLAGERREQMLIKTSFNESNGVVSPDGKWLAYESTESGPSEVYVSPFPDVSRSRQSVSTGGGTRPLWSRDGRELFYYIEPGTIMSVPVTPGTTLTLGKPVEVVKGPYARAVNNGRHYDVSSDGRRFLLLKDVAAPGTDKPELPELHLVLHWDEELKRLVP